MGEFIPIGRLRQAGRFSVRDQPANLSFCFDYVILTAHPLEGAV
jgi:hypothetical protein